VMLLLPSCAITPPAAPVPVPTNEGLCLGLGPAIDDLAAVLQDPAVPDQAVIAGAKVVKGFDEGCQ
jgi:hypothetical protein